MISEPEEAEFISSKISNLICLSISLNFLREITLEAKDIDNIGCLEPFLPL